MLQAISLPTAECKVCCQTFFQRSTLHSICSPKCALRLPVVNRKAEKAERLATKAKLLAMKPRKYWVSKAQEAFNGWVRARDTAAGHGCIDCGKPFEPQKVGGSMDAGHYLSRGSAPHLKFDERNVFVQRKNCNRPGGAKRDDFRRGVINRIGLEAVEALESDQSVKKYSIPELQAMAVEYRARKRAIEDKA